MSYEHPANQKLSHEIVINAELEQRKTFDSLRSYENYSKCIDKSLNMIKSFSNQSLDPKEEVYYNTTSNGFVSALSISHYF